MSEMDEHFEELISAFFDGEATAEQRQQVETLLTENSDARALLEELNALRADVKSLPTYQLESDFADRVIGRIQQAVQENGAPPANDGLAGALDDGQDVAPSVARTVGHATDRSRDTLDSGMGRGLLWSALALAAAVLIMVVTGNNDRELAQHDAPAAGEATKEHGADEAADESGAADWIAAAKTAEANQQAAKMTGPAGQEPLTASEVYAPDAKRAAAVADDDRGFGSVTAGRDPRATPGANKNRADELGFAAADKPLDAAPVSGTIQDAPAPDVARRDALATGNLPVATHGVAFFQVARGTDPADIEAVFRNELKAEKLPSGTLALRRDKEGKQLSQLAEQQKNISEEKSSDGGGARPQEAATIYLELEGTSDQIAKVLKRFEAQRRSVRLVRTDQRLGDMLAHASQTDPAGQGRTGFKMKKDTDATAEAVDELADDDQLAKDDVANEEVAPDTEKGKQRGLAQPATSPLQDANGSAATRGGRHLGDKKPSTKDDTRPAPIFAEGEHADNEALDRASEDRRRERQSTDEADDGEQDKSNGEFARDSESDASKREYERPNSRQFEGAEGKLARTRKVAPGKSQNQRNQTSGEAASGDQESQPRPSLDFGDGLPAKGQAAPGAPLAADPEDGQVAQGDRVYRILLVVELGRTFDTPTAAIRAKPAEDTPAASIESSEVEIEADVKQ